MSHYLPENQEIFVLDFKNTEVFSSEFLDDRKYMSPWCYMYGDVFRGFKSSTTQYSSQDKLLYADDKFVTLKQINQPYILLILNWFVIL